MKIILIILISLLIQVSVYARPESESEFEVEKVVPVTGEEEELVDSNSKLQSEPEDDEEDDIDALGENGNVSVLNQDDDVDNNGEPTAQPNPQTPVQPNPDQPRVYTSVGSPASEHQPQPEYTPLSGRDYPPQSCHGGQYQCQKTDPKAQTRCIPQEWKCNGLRDCELNDDESGCTTDQLTRGRTQTKCTHEQYQCHGSGINSIPPHCIERRLVCDGTYQCSYGDDEANCADRNRPSVYPNRVSHQNNDQTSNRADPRVDPRADSRADPRPDPRADPRADPRDNREMYRPSDRTTTGDRKSEEYVQRLEWRDRCFRSCLKY